MGLLRRSSRSEVAEPAAARSAVHAGVPGRCPECDGFGYIDNIDLRFRFQTQHCPDCGHRWEFSFDEHGDVIDLTDGSPESTSR